MKRLKNWIKKEIAEEGLLGFIGCCLFFLLCSPLVIPVSICSFLDWLNEKTKALGGVSCE